MAHINFVISQNVKWGHAGFYIDCHGMTVPENILLQKSTDWGVYTGIRLRGFLITSMIINKQGMGFDLRHAPLRIPTSIFSDTPLVVCHIQVTVAEWLASPTAV